MTRKEGVVGSKGHGSEATVHEFCVRGIHCTDCAEAITKGLETEEGILTSRVNVGSGRVCVEYDPGCTGPARIEAAVQRMGYSTDLGGDRPSEGGVLRSSEFYATATAGVLLAIGLALELLLSAPPLLAVGSVVVEIHHVVLLAAMIAGGAFVLRRAIGALLKRTFVADGLMIIAAVGATAIGEMAEGAAVLFLYSMAELLEDVSAERNRRSLRALVALAPRMVRVRGADAEVEVPVETVRAGDVAVVRPGERIPVDGVVMRGTSSVSQAAITGESAPVDKAPGSEVFAGTQNLEGVIEIEVSRLAQDTTLARIIALVEEAEERRAPVERFIDRFARLYTPAILIMALLVATVPPMALGGDGGTWIYRALMLLVIACPCALAISVPMAVVSAISGAARHGVLFKGGAYLELLSRVDTVALDKTGTLTTGTPSLVAVVPATGRSEADVLGLAAGLEGPSEHHLAQAVLEAARGLSVEAVPIKEFRAVPGKGVEGVRADTGAHLRLGRPDWLEDLGIELDHEASSLLTRGGRTMVALSEGDEPVGMLAFSDTVRDGARSAVAAMAGTHVLLLTGDNEEAARSVAREVGIDEVRAGLLPEGKVEVVRRLRDRGATVAMVGDGVNDAPSLAEADVGIAMGATGSDLALEASDVVLMRDDLSRVPAALGLAKRSTAVIHQNIVLAISIKLAVAAMVFLGLATLWMAVAIGDMGASLAVILNAFRLGNGVTPSPSVRARTGRSMAGPDSASAPEVH